MKDFFAIIAGFAVLAVGAKLFSHFLYDGGMASEMYAYISFITLMLVKSEIEIGKIRKQLEEVKARQ